MIEEGILQCISEKKAAQPSPTLLSIPCSLRSHRIANRTHENVGKSPASILYRKNYKMPTQYLPPFSCFSPHTLSKVIPQHSETQGIYMIICLSLRSNRQSLSRQQGMILIKTANAVITLFSSIRTMDKKRVFSGRRELLKAYPNMKENGMACYSRQQAVLRDIGINTLEMKCIIESYYPAASTSKPQPRQYPDRCKQ